MMAHTLPGKELLKLLSHDTQNNIEKTSEAEWVLFYEKMKSKEWKRKKYMTHV